MAQRDFPPLSLPNTFRDSNDISTATEGFILPSASNVEPMDFNDNFCHSVIRSNEADHPRTRFNNSLSQNHVNDTPLMKSIIRPVENDNEKSTLEQPEQLYNGSLINDNNLISEAAGYDQTRSAELDADAAYALQLQQEEYLRESLMAHQHPYLPFQVPVDDESAAAPLHPLFGPSNQHFMNDEQFAAYLQEQESSRPSHRYHRPQIPFFRIRQQPNPESTEPIQRNEQEIEPIPSFVRFHQQNHSNYEDDSDEENPYMNIPNPFVQFLANQGQPLPEHFAPIFHGFRRHGYRRTGNIQETEEDFGPDDYERLLQLDDTIHKKKLTKTQINTIKPEKFIRKQNNTDEENKCSVCLEHFQDNQILRRFPCDHIYHKDCADRWLQENNVCPICRKPPIKEQSTNNSRHNRINNFRPSNNTRNNNHRNNNNTNTNSNTNNNTPHHHFHRRGPDFQRQS